jgi:putative PIN family toxin of toxin-antitoxin system
VRVVCDTNIFVSALVFGGKPRKFLELARKNVVLVVSEPLLQELRRVLTSKFGWADHRVLIAIREIARTAELVKPDIEITDCRDRDDNRILEAALAGRVDFIVSGYADLLSMRSFRGIQIVSVSIFLDRIEP